MHRGGHDLGGDPGKSLSVQVEALVQADTPVKPGASFPVSGRAAEPMRTPSKRAPGEFTGPAAWRAAANVLGAVRPGSWPARETGAVADQGTAALERMEEPLVRGTPLRLTAAGWPLLPASRPLRGAYPPTPRPSRQPAMAPRLGVASAHAGPRQLHLCTAKRADTLPALQRSSTRLADRYITRTKVPAIAVTPRSGSAAEALVGRVVRHGRVGEGRGKAGCEDAAALESDSLAPPEGIVCDLTVLQRER